MNNCPEVAGATLRLHLRRTVLAALVLGVSSALAIWTSAQPPTKPKDSQLQKQDFTEVPARRLIENLAPTANLPRGADRSAKNQALKLPAAPFGPLWKALGPFPIPNGQTENRVDPVSGRVTAIVAHPTNAQVAYVGAAQGGLYRTLDGGSTWTQLMDNAASSEIGAPLAIGALALDPTNPSTVFVGTGEGNSSGDSYFGNGLYIITSADGSNPIVNGPYNLRTSDSADIFTGRSITGIAIDPANHNNVFITTASGFGGIVPSTYSVLPPRGIYRSTNAFAAINATGTPSFTQLIVNSSETNAMMTSVVIEFARFIVRAARIPRVEFTAAPTHCRRRRLLLSPKRCPISRTRNWRSRNGMES